MGVDDLAQAQLSLGEHIASLITNRYHYTKLAESVDHHLPSDIKGSCRLGVETGQRTQEPSCHGGLL